MVDDCEISEFLLVLTWHDRVHECDEHPQVHRDYSAARQHRVSLLLLLISSVTIQSWTWFKQSRAHTQTNRTGGCWWWGGTLATCVWLPVPPPPATPHRLCHYLPDKLLGNRTLLDIFTSSSCRNTIFIFPKTSYHKDRIPSILLTSITWQRNGWSKYHLK